MAVRGEQVSDGGAAVCARHVPACAERAGRPGLLEVRLDASEELGLDLPGFPGAFVHGDQVGIADRQNRGESGRPRRLDLPYG
jgi:hypothetical protein